MRGEIVTIGNELLTGLVTDTNAAHIARELFAVGIDTAFLTTVGDIEEDIADALIRASGRARAVVVTGGLGPTPDDITSRAASRAFGKSQVLDPDAFEHIKARYLKRNMPIGPTAERQALVPRGARIIENPVGSAPGFMVEYQEALFFFIPGVPEEMAVITAQGVVPIIREKLTGHISSARKILKIFGLTETQVYERVRPVLSELGSVSVGFLPVYPENRISLISRSEVSPADAFDALDAAERLIRERLDEYIFGENDDSLEQIVGRLLGRAGMTIAVAESCTGGLLSQRITSIPGSSDYFIRGVVSYSNEAKSRYLGVEPGLIEDHGAVSDEVARAMATGVREGAAGGDPVDIGVAITGIAGPTGGSEQKPVGTVFVALAHEDGGCKTVTECKRYQFMGDRDRVRMISSQVVLEWVRRYMLSREESSTDSS
ncbi:MAG: competence/damage-inducible protein A [Deltaproteobacteria bacterium]|nr:competence/damage-inducible protein A [Candidatus Zymogenaceae bacterium]